MAEKPRLKKSDEILGSIASETAKPARASRTGGRAPDKSGGQQGREPEPKEKAVKTDFIEEDIELTDAPVLPSAQSLAEKLLPKKQTHQRDLGAYKPAAQPASIAETHIEPKPAAKSASIEFGADFKPDDKQSSAPMEFQAAPAPAKSATIEIGGTEPPERTPPRQSAPQRQEQSRQQQPRQQQQAQRQAPPQPPARAVQEFEAVPPPTIAEYTFQSFEETKAAEKPEAVWEFSAEDEQSRARARRENEPPQPRRERIIRPLKKPETPATPSYEETYGESYEPPFEQMQEQRQEPEHRQPQAPAYEPEPERRQPGTYEPEPERRQPGAYEPEPERARPSAYEPEPERTRPPAAPPAYTPPPQPEVSEAERNRQEFMKRIASQFEVQFEEKFEDGALRPRNNAVAPGLGAQREPLFPTGEPPFPERERSEQPREPLFPSREPLFPQSSAPEPKNQEPVSKSDQIDGEDFLSYVQRQERERRSGGEPDLRSQLLRDREPERRSSGDDNPVVGFIEKFEQNIREEEHQRSEDFKETLSQKFMRERERYLKELEISGNEPEQEPELPTIEASSSVPPRRRLDFQIQPEMHMQNGTLPQAAKPRRPESKPQVMGPVTYTRGGAARSQVDDSDSGLLGMSLAPERGANAERGTGGKKTGEQLLMEHTRARGSVPKQTLEPAKPLKFTFETPDERSQKLRVKKGKKESVLPTEKWPRRIILIAMAAGLMSLALVVWSMVSYYNLANRPAIIGESMPSDDLPVTEETLDVYNDRNFTQTATANNVFFKTAGTLLKNVDVKEHIVIENVDGSGRIRLEDVSVGSAISVKSSASDTLELHNVKAERLIINNPLTNMTLNATGNTNIGIVELRTKSTVKQADIGIDFEGIRAMVVTSAEPGGEINAALDGLSLRTLETDAGTAVLSFAGNTRAENFSANGSLSLSGNGKVSTLSIGAKTGQGAGDLEDRNDIILFIKDVSVSNLNVKSPMTLNLATSVDSLSTTDPVTIGGEASIATLTLNPKTNSSQRLLIDIVSANVQTLYANTPSRINVTGASRINELTADASTYALGNKVNHLKVNADDVVYENEPDRTTTATGIKSPQSKAENPNIDYNLGVAQQNVTDVSGEDFATTCGHSRESGGFLVGDGSNDSPYEVSTAMQLAHAGAHLASHFVQTDNIDISTESTLAANFPSIGGSGAPFEGVYDGRGFGISKLNIVSQADNIGLFGANKGMLQNVRILSGDITTTSISQAFAGGIAGLNIEGGQIRSSANGATVNGNQNTVSGGIAGGNFGGRIHDCYNYATIRGVDIVGGIVGLNRQGASITGSYNVGLIDGRDQIGAVTGKNEDGTIANCYFLDTSSQYGIGMGSGTATAKTNEELASAQMAADLSAGNESSLWTSGSIAAGYGYPVHKRPE